MISPWLVYKTFHYIKYKKRLYQDVFTIQSDLINNMDHMRISGTEPSDNP